jgi:hypothetical protein
MSILHRFSVSVAAVLAVALMAAPSQAQTGIKVDTLSLTGVNFDPVAGLLTAAGGTVTGTVSGLPFTTDIENFTLQLQSTGAACSVLDLQLGPISLNLLGLHVDTTPICLEVTALPGQGILGDLLCGLAGGNLELIPSLQKLLTRLLTFGLAQPTQAGGVQGVCSGTCQVLDLTLAPVDLTLLGINVLLDNCSGSSIEVCISATAGEGLLGDLLCGISGLQIDGPNLSALVDAITGIPGVEELRPSADQVSKMIETTRHGLVDGELSVVELQQVIETVF